MATVHDKITFSQPVTFTGLSSSGIQLSSYPIQLFEGYSIGSFNANRILGDPNKMTLPQLANAFATLVTDLIKPK